MKRNNQRLIKLLVLLISVVALLGIFTGCGGSSKRDETTESKYTPPFKDPPEILEIPELPTYDFEYDAPAVEHVPPVTVYAASSESNKYHETTCYYVDNILPDNLIYFHSKSEARSEGYSPCSYCDP